MGKYVGKRRGEAGDRAPAARVVLGVRTRSRSAAGAATPRRRKAATARMAKEEEDAGVCYLHLRSRRLFMAAAAEAAHRGPKAEAAEVVNSGEAVVVAGISRCSSTASSVDVLARGRSGGAAEACEDCDVESSVSDSGRCVRERRESTPSSRPPGDSSDLGSSHAADEQQHHRQRCPATTTATSATFSAASSRASTTPPPTEIEEFFAAEEKAEAERFAAKYNFDVARGVPINAGRFDWTPVVASG